MSKKTTQQSTWYDKFYTDFYLSYFHEESTPEIKKEVNFIRSVFKLPKTAKILDLACGPGRHSIELAKQGFNIIGLDFNTHFLNIAKKKARKESLDVEFVLGDMRKLSYWNEFNAVVCMYTSFGYFSKKDNSKVLENISKSLTKNGLLLLDLPNKDWVVNKLPKKTWQKFKDEYLLEERSFDKKKGTFKNEITVISSNCKINKTYTDVHLYDQKEIEKELKKHNMVVSKIFGNYDTKAIFNSKKFPRMIILAEKRDI